MIFLIFIETRNKTLATTRILYFLNIFVIARISLFLNILVITRIFFFLNILVTARIFFILIKTRNETLETIRILLFMISWNRIFKTSKIVLIFNIRETTKIFLFFDNIVTTMIFLTFISF